MTFIRYFCSMDSSPSGIVALAHLDALREVTKTPIRLIGVAGASLFTGKAQNGWRRHIDLISTPIEKEYINVVCAESAKWASLHTAKLVRSTNRALEYPSGCQKNILILSETITPGLKFAAERYDVVLNAKAVAAAAAAASPADKEIAHRRVNLEALRAAVA